MKTKIPALILGLLALAGCSKNDAPTVSSSTPSATPVGTATVTPIASTTPSATASPFADVGAQLRDLENRMDAVFADTFRSAGNWFNQTTRANSVDLREQNDKYIARLYVPKGDTSNVDAKVEHGVLHITSQNQGTVDGKNETERYEQFITLPKPVQGDKVNVQKREDVVVISVPKTTASAPAVAAATPAPAATVTASPNGSPADWADQLLAQMNQMQARLNQTVRDVFQNDVGTGASNSQLGSAMNIEDQNDKYIVHFYLPDKNLSDINVKFENNALHLVAQEQKKSDAAAGWMQSTSVTRYETMTTLPGPVKDAEMKVDRKEGSVIVTLPKS
jgi:HSP20 family molecular chaperone IbpA